MAVFDSNSRIYPISMLDPNADSSIITTGVVPLFLQIAEGLSEQQYPDFPDGALIRDSADKLEQLDGELLDPYTGVVYDEHLFSLDGGQNEDEEEEENAGILVSEQDPVMKKQNMIFSLDERIKEDQRFFVDGKSFLSMQKELREISGDSSLVVRPASNAMGELALGVCIAGAHAGCSIKTSIIYKSLEELTKKVPETLLNKRCYQESSCPGMVWFVPLKHKAFLNSPQLMKSISEQRFSKTAEDVFARALKGHSRYLNRHGSHLHFVSKLFQSGKGKKRALTYQAALQVSGLSILRRYLVLYAELATHNGKQLKLDIAKSLGKNASVESAKKYIEKRIVDHFIKNAPQEKREAAFSEVDGFVKILVRLANEGNTRKALAHVGQYQFNSIPEMEDNNQQTSSNELSL